MKHLKGIFLISGFTMAGEVLNRLLPFPVPAGVYGLFLLLAALCLRLIRLEDISAVGDFLLDTMPLMFIPAAVGLMDCFGSLKAVLFPAFVISLLSTLFVMAVTGKTAQVMIRRKKKGEKR